MRTWIDGVLGAMGRFLRAAVIATGAAGVVPGWIAAQPGLDLSVAMEVPELGIDLRVPPEINRRTVQRGASESALILTPAHDGWSIRIAEVAFDDRRPTPVDLLDLFVGREIAAARVLDPNTNEPVGSGAVIDRRLDRLRIGERNAARAYVSKPVEAGGTTTIRAHIGITVVEAGPNRFVAARVDTRGDRAAEHIRLYEAIMASMRFRDGEHAATQRGIAVRAADRFVQLLSEDDFNAVLSEEPRFYRLYEPGPTTEGDIEVGYQRVTIRRGQLGEVDRSIERDDWNTEQRQFGYFVELRARLFVPFRVDTGAFFFLSRNRDFEVGRVETAVTNGTGEPLRVSEDIIRREGRLTVKTINPGQPASFYESNTPDRGYLSRAELYMLPLLVARVAGDDGAAAFDFGFYHYDSSQSAMVFRTDSFERLGGGTGWAHRSVRFPGASETVASLDAEGELIRRELDAGRVMEPVDPEELRRLYALKNIE